MQKDTYLESFKSVLRPDTYQVLLDKRAQIFDITGKLFNGHLESTELTLSSITITACDQGGWPFQALYMKIGTGHSEVQFCDMVLAVLKVMSYGR